MARRAAVSPATVSLVLSGRFREGRRVSEETQQRVLAAARELGYSPNHVARSLRQQRTGILALVTPGLSSYYSDIILAAQRAAMEFGYVVNISIAPQPDTRRRSIELLHGGVADGVIVAHHANELREELRELRRRGIPTVAVQDRPPDRSIPAVRVDIDRGARLATSHLIGLGHRRIAYLTVDPDEPQDGRLHGYRAALAEAGIRFRRDLVITTERAQTRLRAGAATARALLERPGPRPTAAFVYNDLMAIGVLRSLTGAGVRIPDDIAVIGFDGIEWGAFTTPTLSTVAHPRREQGRIAVEMLCSLLAGKAVRPVERVLPTDLIVRESCGGAG